MNKRWNFILIAFAGIVLNSCGHNSDKTPTVGGLDTAAVVNDTLMQLGIERSYEFNQTVALNENEVFDIEARGEPKQGTLQFIYRNKEGRDTVLKTGRTGIVKGCWLTEDMNRNTLPEIIIALQATDNRKLETVAAYEIGKDKKLQPLSFNVQMPQEARSQYQGFDSIYYSKGDNALYQVFNMDSAGITKGRVKYKLKAGTFEGDKFEALKQ